MEIARLEVSTQQHLDRMQETAKVKYVQYGKLTKHKEGKTSTQSGASEGSYKGTSSKPGGKGKKLPFHSIEEIIGKFHGMTRFTIADFNKGYWMVELDPESRKFTTMALDIGRFQWTRFPMGSIVAQDVFQRKLDAIFLSIPGVTGIADDMIIYGRNDQEHDEHLVNFLEVCRKNTLTLNPDKMQFRLPQVSFFGHQWSARGLSPDPKKIAAVK